jgi:hypothetical protein
VKRRPSSRRPQRSLGVEPAAHAIANALAFHGISDRVRAERLVTEWTELVGPKISQRTRPNGIIDRVLYIEVASSAWLQELNLLRAQLTAQLVERLGDPRLFDKLEFRLAGRRSRDNVTIPRPRARTVRVEKPLPPPASGAAREKIVREVAAVEDDDLRELIARLRITHDK